MSLLIVRYEYKKHITSYHDGKFIFFMNDNISCFRIEQIQKRVIEEYKNKSEISKNWINLKKFMDEKLIQLFRLNDV